MSSLPENEIKVRIEDRAQEKKWRQIAYLSILILISVFGGYTLYSYLSYDQFIDLGKELYGSLDEKFLWMLFVGFAAQMVDGALGMGYGVVSTTLLLSGGLNPAVISGSVHTAEMFSSGASGFSHYRFGNVNKKLFKTLLIPGVLGAIGGSLLLCYAGEAFSQYIRPVISVYTLLLGVKILSNAFKKQAKPQKVKRAGWLAGAGGFLDSFGGGGWGPLVTSTLISKGRTPKYVIGSVSLTEFFVTMASAVTFFIILGVSHWQSILGLIIGGVAAAPLAARLVGKLPVKKMFIGVAAIVIISSVRIIWMSLGKLL
ncbi:sulfite exporter TauE/SafE family protein [Pedobacter sp. MC2016-24]|uniref:sulfite exporter TauE/SafE family protein n=1 Tax=Pedobacter sp. MC2016-24 TaxID=2780090 RepID=UPI00187FBE82|nr:sulfite exporter TauE/SafE family protein [Pedobacter sp. MC2016-24]MBE9597711.1 sulfite exporter TauE/SafE family protein [Pedobacter sp. MC2016-24]